MKAFRMEVVPQRPQFVFFPMLAALALMIGGQHAARSGEFSLPPGFSIREFASSKLVHDLQAMAIDKTGRIFVASRAGIVRLVDFDGDRIADQTIAVADFPKDGAMGLLVEAEWLYFTGDGKLGRFRLDPAGRKSGPVETLLDIRTGGEHAAHAIRRGPDGWLYLLCGNEAGLVSVVRSRKFDREHSPVSDPIAGGVVRLSPDYSSVQVVCDGFRNPYDMDFGCGRLFTHDSDNERCVSLPWYEGTRVYEVLAGGHYGWLNPQRATTWRMPPYFPDVVPPLADLGRGSPTGVTFYDHAHFPHEFRGGLFVSDWTFGTIQFVRLESSVDAIVAKPRRFLDSRGENGFAPTATCVDPTTGELFVSVGGRGTRGAVYRIRFDGERDSNEHGTTERMPAPAVHRFDRDGVDRFTAKGIDKAASDLRLGRIDPASCLMALRHIQRACGQLEGIRTAKGTVFEGYSGTLSALPVEFANAAAESFPTGHEAVDREIVRMFAVAGTAPPGFVEKLSRQWTDASDPVADTHCLIAFARIAKHATSETFNRAAGAMLSLVRKLDARSARRDRNWPLRIVEIQSAIIHVDDRFNQRLADHPEFGRYDHAIFCAAKGFDRLKAARKFLSRMTARPDTPPTSAAVAVLEALPASEAKVPLRRWWNEFGLRPSIARVLARSPEFEDRERFLEGIEFSDAETAEACAGALLKLRLADDSRALWIVMRALRRTEKEASRNELTRRLRAVLRQATESLDDSASGAQWEQWLRNRFPTLAAGFVENSDWKSRLDGIDWQAGDSGRGEAAYRKFACAHCHAGNRATGPDLHGVAGRFSREDLFGAIFEPENDVGTRYRTTVFETQNGQTFEGMVVYEAADGILVQTGIDRTIRLDPAEVSIRRQTHRSLMPKGLLDHATNEELANLYAYLKSLNR